MSRLAAGAPSAAFGRAGLEELEEALAGEGEEEEYYGNEYDDVAEYEGATGREDPLKAARVGAAAKARVRREKAAAEEEEAAAAEESAAEADWVAEARAARMVRAVARDADAPQSAQSLSRPRDGFGVRGGVLHQGVPSTIAHEIVVTQQRAKAAAIAALVEQTVGSALLIVHDQLPLHDVVAEMQAHGVQDAVALPALAIAAARHSSRVAARGEGACRLTMPLSRACPLYACTHRPTHLGANRHCDEGRIR